MLLSYPGLVSQFNCTVNGVIHVGGHIGEELGVYKAQGVRNLIMFEPQKHCFDQIVERSNEMGMDVKLVNKGLGNTTGEMEIISEPTGLCGSLLNPKEVYNFPDLHKERWTHREMVEVVKMDDEIPEDHTYNFLNMDTQGYELEVLRGGLRTLEKIDYIYTEVNKVEVYEDNALVEEIDEFLNGYNMKRVNEWWHVHGWGDAFYVKSNLI